MDETIAVAIGRCPGRESKLTKLGSQSAEGQANTFRTFATAFTRADGGGHSSIHRDGALIASVQFHPEDEKPIEVRVTIGRDVQAEVREAEA